MKVFLAMILALTFALGGCATTGGHSVRYTCATASASLRVLTPVKHKLSQSVQDSVTKAALDLKPYCGAAVEPSEVELQDAAAQHAIAELVAQAAKVKL